MGNITALRQGSLNGLRRQTNECLVNAYNKGYQDGKKEIPEIANNENEMYDRGVEDLSKAIVWYSNLKHSERVKYIGENLAIYGLIRDTPQKLIEGFKAYEENKQAEEEWKIGDELSSETTNRHAIIVRVDAWNSYECFSDDGIFKITDEFKKYWVKIGHFAEVSQLLDKLKGDK